MLAVILAGGLGTRMGEYYKSTPKPLIKINGKPVLQHQVEMLRKEGIRNFLLVVGHKWEQIEEYFGNGQKFGVNIEYYIEDEPLGTAGALLRLSFKDDFLLCNGDLIFDFSLQSMLNFHKEKNALATLFCHPNSHPYDSTIILTDNDNRVTDFVSPSDRNGYYPNLCNAGIHIISPGLFNQVSFKKCKANLDKDVLLPALSTNRIYAYKSHEYVHDMGTPERLADVEADVKSGVVSALHKSQKQKAVFLDRDGTVNVHKGYITNPKEIKMLPHAADAISKFNRLGYLSIIITNQPVIARGECTEEELRNIHNYLETLLGEEGAYVDGIYYCPHHPDQGYENEIPELKIKCNCRKPSPGLILRAAEDFNIDLSKSYMVGDSPRDTQAALNAGCIPVFLSSDNKCCSDNISVYRSLIKFAEKIKD